MAAVAPPRLLNVLEVAEYLGMSRNRVYLAIREGGLPHYRLNDWSIRIDLDELKAWLQESRRGGDGG